GIDEPILRQALAQAYDGRMHILGKMLETLPAPRPELSKYAPKIIQFKIDPDKIGEVVGTKGKTINKIIEDTGVKIDIEDDGSVYIATENAEAAQRAKQMIEGIVKELKVGDVFTGKVVRIMNFGAFVEYAPGKDGMIHISKLENKRVEKVEDVVNIGDTLECRVAEIDAQGRINLVRNDIVYDNDAMPVRKPASGFRRNSGAPRR
ncbi:MAG: S1 RNA-binding domain-containing protein, partial [Clostridia bacterium]|nr:S1 RNA-binding domain-containing protein [Clostridia bacterium]